MSSHRTINKRNALRYAKFGLFGFPSNGKTPLVPRFNLADTEMTQDERNAAAAEYSDRHGELPVHVGATRSEAVIKSMFARYPDAVWSLATGPNHLVVIDADKKDDGVTKLKALFRENGGAPDGCIEVPTRSGGAHFYFRDSERKFSNRTGLMKSRYGCDIRGNVGQVVSPGSMLQDGARYGDANHVSRLTIAISKGSLPELPAFVADKINVGSHSSASTSVEPSQERAIVEQLGSADFDEISHVFDETLGSYDLVSFCERDLEFSELYRNPAADRSSNRFKAARLLMREWPNMSAPELCLFFQSWEGAGQLVEGPPAAGEFDTRQVAREWLKCRGRGKPSTGEAFGPVDDDSEPDQSGEGHSKTRAEESRSLHLGSELVRQYKPPEWFVQNLLAPRTVGAISGPSNVGKSFSALDLAWHIVNGREWFGLKVEQSGVLYAYGEGWMGVASRLLALAQAKGESQGDIVVRDGIPNFASNPKAAIKALKRAVVEANEMLARTGGAAVKLLIVDTFAKATAGAEENSAKDMGLIMAALRQLADELSICILVIHHTGKSAAQALRGSSAILADLDFNIELLDHEAGKARRPTRVSIPKGQLCLQVAKMRDGRKGNQLFFKLEPVVLGKDKWGDDLVSMVVRPLTGTFNDGAVLDAVNDDDEAPQVRDMLTEENIRDANIREEARRSSNLRKIAEAVRVHGVKVGPKYSIKVQSLATKVDCLRELKETSGASNLVRNIRSNLFLKDAEVDLEGGRLQLMEPTARGGSVRLAFVANSTVH